MPALYIHKIEYNLFQIFNTYAFKVINPASTEKLFFEFLSDFSVWYSLIPLEMRSERKNFLSALQVCFLGATRFVCLVLTGVRVANFFNIAHFDLISSYRIHIGA